MTLGVCLLAPKTLCAYVTVASMMCTSPFSSSVLVHGNLHISEHNPESMICSQMIHKLFTGTSGYALNSIIHRTQEDKAHGEKTTEEGQVATVPWKSQWTRTAPGVADRPLRSLCTMLRCGRTEHAWLLGCWSTWLPLNDKEWSTWSTPES